MAVATRKMISDPILHIDFDYFDFWRKKQATLAELSGARERETQKARRIETIIANCNILTSRTDSEMSELILLITESQDDIAEKNSNLWRTIKWHNDLLARSTTVDSARNARIFVTNTQAEISRLTATVEDAMKDLADNNRRIQDYEEQRAEACRDLRQQESRVSEAEGRIRDFMEKMISKAGKYLEQARKEEEEVRRWVEQITEYEKMIRPGDSLETDTTLDQTGWTETGQIKDRV